MSSAKYISFPKVEGLASRQAHADLPEGTALDVPRLAKPFSQDDLVQLIARLEDQSRSQDATRH